MILPSEFLRLFAATVLAACALQPLRSQEGTLAPGHPDLIYAFLRHHLRIADSVQTADISAAVNLEDTAAAVYKVDGAAFSKVTTAARRARAKLDELAAAEDEYVQPFMRERRLPDMRTLAEFVEKRQNVLRSLLRDLKSVLEPTAYERILEYINSDLRRAVITTRSVR